MNVEIDDITTDAPTSWMTPFVGDLAEALAKAQGGITGARKDSANPFFKSKYADLASVWDACREHLSANNLAVIQTMVPAASGITVITTLVHSSGQWIRGELNMVPVKNDPQGIGSCITYARRYALAAIVGVAQVDDDANSAQGHTKADPLGRADLTVNGEHQKYADAFRAPDADYASLHADLKNEGEEFYRAVWSLLDSKIRSAIKRAIA